MLPQTIFPTEIGLPVQESAPTTACVLSVHRNVINLRTDKNELVALVDFHIGPGPYNLVLPNWPVELKYFKKDAALKISPLVWQIGDIFLDLSKTTSWDPRPNWKQLNNTRKFEQAEQILRNWLQKSGVFSRVLKIDSVSLGILRQRVKALQVATNEKQRVEAAQAIIGLGPGLTPVGDDWLTGWFLRLYSRGDFEQWGFTIKIVVNEAKNRTTFLSQEFLRAAANGWTDGAWMRLLKAMSVCNVSEIERQAAAIAERGSTSGVATLAGFLNNVDFN